MKRTEILKIAAVALISSGLIAGCATTEEPAPEPEATQECPNAAAKNAIYTAKIKLLMEEVSTGIAETVEFKITIRYFNVATDTCT